MDIILKLIDEGKSREEIIHTIWEGKHRVPLFQPLEELGHYTLYDHLQKYTKFKDWTLELFIDSGAIDFKEQDKYKKTLLQRLISNKDIFHIKKMLLRGVWLNKEDYDSATEQVKKFFDYRPGSGQPSIFEFCSCRKREKNYGENLLALLSDEADTTENESSAAEELSDDELTSGELAERESFREKQLKAGVASDSLCLMAARGVHFSEKYFSPDTVQKVRRGKKRAVTSLSLSTLFDAGYKADDEVDETDPTIQHRHRKNIAFIEELKRRPDKKEKRIRNKPPTKSRNEITFDSHYFRYMQVYINSYSHLFGNSAIKVDFGFDTNHNPELSASWDIAKAGMYASGYRFDWKERGLRKDPHYRRFTGKAKHPNLGYVDIFVFDPRYVREHAFDRYLMHKEGKIHLSALFMYEAEVIFHSMIPKRYHYCRSIIAAPSFDHSHSKKEFARYGIDVKGTHTKYKNRIRKLPQRDSDEYREVVNTILKKAVESQATLIEKTTHCRLFRAEPPKVVVYDHGDTLKAEPIKP